jgi:hypothetical protein
MARTCVRFKAGSSSAIAHIRAPPVQIAGSARFPVLVSVLGSHSIFIALTQPGLYCRRMEPRGLYRERNGWGNQHSVRVKYDEHQELDLAEDRYRTRGYHPPFEKLPWKDESDGE